jgi:hypothetical protein
MSDNVNINIQETNEIINIVSSEIQEVIDIDVFETTEDVTLNITEEIIQVNINKVTPAEQIQSDWNQTDAEALDFIKNKPSIPDGIEINKGVLNPTTTEITAPTNTETHFYRIIANGTVNGTLAVKVGDIVGINSTTLWLESNNNQVSIIDKGYITIFSPVQLANSVNAQPIFNKVFKAKPNTRYEYKLIIFCTDLSGSQNMLLGFNNSQNSANPLNGIIANMFQGNAARGSVTNGFSSFSIISTEIVVTGTSSDTRFNCGLTGTLTTGNAPSGLSFCDVIPIIKTPVGQANAFISRAYFTIEEVGNKIDMFNGNFQ